MKTLFLFLLFSTGAFAHSFYIEPNLGYSFYSKSGFAIKEDSPGVIGGARIGYMRKRIFLAVDWQHLLYDRKDTNESATGNDIALTLGIDFPNRFRAFMGAILLGNFDASSVGNVDGAHGFKVGIGYKFYSYWAVNLEIRQTKYNATNQAQFADFKSWGSALTISIPWEIEIKKVRKSVTL